MEVKEIVRICYGNVNGVDTNPFHSHMGSPIEGFIKVVMTAEASWGGAVSKFFTPGMLTDIEELAKVFGFPTTPEAERYISNIAEGGTYRLMSNEVEDARFISMADRKTARLNSTTWRPSPVCLGGIPRPCEWWKQYLEYMSKAGKNLKVLPAKYPMPPELRAASQKLQLVLLAMYDALHFHIVFDVCDAGKLLIKLQADCRARENLLLSTIKEKLMSHDVVAAVEMSPTQIAEVKQWEERGECSIVFHDDSKPQRSALIFGPYMRLLVTHSMSMDAYQLAMALVKFRDCEVAIAAYHSDSKGEETIEAMGVIEEQADLWRADHLIVALDANTTRIGRQNKLPMPQFLDAINGYHIAPNPFDVSKWTVTGAKTVMQAQPSKAVMVGEAIVRDTCDFIVTTGTFAESSLHIDRAEHDLSRVGKVPCVILPSRFHYTDHAWVSAVVEVQ